MNRIRDQIFWPRRLDYFFGKKAFADEPYIVYMSLGRRIDLPDALTYNKCDSTWLDQVIQRRSDSGRP